MRPCPSSPSATAYAIFPSYSCRFHVPLSLNNLSFSTPSPSPSCISTSIKSTHQFPYNSSSVFRKGIIFTGFEADSKNIVKCTGGTNIEFEEKENEQEAVDFDCLGTGQDVEGVVSPSSSTSNFEETVALPDDNSVALGAVWEWAVLVSPFFFWGTAMVAMKEVIPKYGPFFVSSFRLIPAGFLLIAFAASRNRPSPSGLTAWLSISLFALVDATCFQGFLAEGLQKTSAGLGSVIIDSQPLTVAILAALLFGESIGFVGAAGLVLGVIGLLLLEVPALTFDKSNFSLWGSGEWWMLLAAQSMAVGTVMVRWVSKYSDPVMATGWVGCTISSSSLLANIMIGSLTKLSSLTFLTPMFASIFGFIYLGETFSPFQLVGAVITLAAIYMVNYRNVVE